MREQQLPFTYTTCTSGTNRSIMNRIISTFVSTEEILVRRRVTCDGGFQSDFPSIICVFFPVRPGCVLRKAHGDDGAGM